MNKSYLLQNYLEAVATHEQALYTLGQMEKTLKLKEGSRLNMSAYTSPPNIEPTRPTNHAETALQRFRSDKSNEILQYGIYLGVLGFFWILALIVFIMMLCLEFPGSDVAFTFIVTLVFTILEIRLIVKMVKAIGNVKKRHEITDANMEIWQDNYKRACENYDKLMTDYIKREKEQKEALEKQLETRNQILSTELSRVNALLTNTRTTLDQLYALDIIFPKYRDMAASTTILEYIASGRCSTLEGYDGAYNLYESELRQNIIIGQLDKVIRKLDQIQRAQFMLYTAIQESNQLLKTMASDIADLKQSSAATAYYSKVTAQNTEAIKNIAFYTAISR